MELCQIPLFQMLAFCKISTEVKLSCHFNYFLEVVTPFFEYPELCSYSSALYKIMTLKKKFALALFVSCTFCQVNNRCFCFFVVICQTNLKEVCKPEYRFSCKMCCSYPD